MITTMTSVSENSLSTALAAAELCVISSAERAGTILFEKTGDEGHAPSPVGEPAAMSDKAVGAVQTLLLMLSTTISSTIPYVAKDNIITHPRPSRKGHVMSQF